MKSFFIKKSTNCRILLPFGFCFLAMRDFISSANCSCSSKMMTIVFAFSRALTLTRVSGRYLLKACCAYATVFNSLLKVPNRSLWVNAFLSSACIKKTDEGKFFSSEAKTRLSHSGQPISCRFKQVVPVIYLLFLSSTRLIALLSMSPVSLIPLACFHCEASVVYTATTITYLHFSLSICFFKLTSMNDACNSYLTN